jgi:hypothetical protein
MIRTSKLLAAGAAMLVMSAGSAYATIVSVTDTVNVAQTNFTGNKPTIGDDLSTTLLLHENTWSTPTSLLTITPAGSSGLSGRDPTVSGTITVTLGFSFTENGKQVTGSVTESGMYSAKYGGSPLGCTGSPAGDTDCIVWNNSTNGSAMVQAVLSGGQPGEVMDVIFYNAQDWSIVPQVSFDLDPTPTPLPAALPLFTAGLGALGLLGWRRKRTARSVAV